MSASFLMHTGWRKLTHRTFNGSQSTVGNLRTNLMRSEVLLEECKCFVCGREDEEGATIYLRRYCSACFYPNKVFAVVWEAKKDMLMHLLPLTIGLVSHGIISCTAIRNT